MAAMFETGWEGRCWLDSHGTSNISSNIHPTSPLHHNHSPQIPTSQVFHSNSTHPPPTSPEPKLPSFDHIPPPLTSYQRRNPKYYELSGFKCLSYNIYADCHCMGIKYSTTKLWITRRDILLKEIISYNADILCLQDVDHYYEWWQPKLMEAGYDTLWKQRTNELYTHNEGAVICYKRNMFQLFKSVDIELNHAGDHESYAVQRICVTDDVGVIAFLQPWKENKLTSAICVCSAMLYDGEVDETNSFIDIRYLQTVYLTKQLEIENRSFHLPVILGISLFDEPSSAAYHVLRTGRKQLMPHPPQRCQKPIVKPFSRASVKVYWKPAQVTEADPPVLRYVISWRPGGNLDLGFCLTKVVQSGDCFEYTTTVNADGKRVTFAKELRSVLVGGLSAETPFEFKICAINEIGQGEWSDASAPIVLANPSKAPPKDQLHFLKDLQGVIELGESSNMAKDDWNVQKAPRVNIYDPQSCTTPRVISGDVDTHIGRSRVLPLSTNPREGWKPSLKGEISSSLKDEILNSKRLKRSLLMTDRGDYRPEVSDTICSRVASYDVDEFIRSRQISRAGTGNYSPSHSVAGQSRRELENDDTSYTLDGFEEDDEITQENEKDAFRYRTNGGELGDDNSDFILEESESLHTPTAAQFEKIQSSTDNLPGTMLPSASTSDPLKKPILNSLILNTTTLSTIPQPHESSWGEGLLQDSDGDGLNQGGKTARKVNDDVVLDLKESIEHIGAPNKREIHALNFRSVYENYSVGGEPVYTQSKPADHVKCKGVCCVDYIFYSSHALKPMKILSIPPLTTLSGDDPSESLVTIDPYWETPPPSFRDIFDNHQRDLPHGKEVGREHRAHEVGKIKEKLIKILKEGDNSGIYSKFWGGRWLPYACSNQRRTHSWLPNDSFASSHMSLCAFFQLNEDYISTQWTPS